MKVQTYYGTEDSPTVSEKDFLNAIKNAREKTTEMIITKIERWPMLPSLEPNAREWIKRLVTYLKTTDIVEPCGAYKGEEYREWIGDKCKVGCTLPKGHDGCHK